MASPVRVAPLAGMFLFLCLGLAAMYPRQYSCAEEKEAVHDAECEARLEHAARLVDADIEGIDPGAPKNTEAKIGRRPSRDIDTVDVGDEAQVIDTRNKGANETEIDKCDELGVRRASVVREQREERPGKAEHRNNEQDQDIVRRQKVAFDVAVDEVGQHAHSGDLRAMRR